MEEPDKPGQGRDSFFSNMKKKAQLTGDIHAKQRKVVFFAGILVLIGLILSFFYIHLGAIFVGLGFGLSFYQEIYSYFLQSRESYSKEGLSKILIGIGTLLFLLLSIPAFIFFAAIGFGVMWLITPVQPNIR